MSGSLWFYYRNEATAFDTDIAETNDVMPVKHKGKLLVNTVASGDKTVLQNVAIAVPLKDVSNFWQTPEKPLMTVAGVKNDDANSMSLQSHNELKTIKYYQNVLAKDLKDIGINIKQKVRVKIQKMSIDIFSNQNLQQFTDCVC